ncbi:cation-translocating P-type ATPase [Candidatus Gottesmanbacteria bacterium]|nr:cation-translocating P-type ATPase [Candidatus Gottesmanbacteria bacterium]
MKTKGLTNAQAQILLSRFGRNELSQKSKATPLTIFLSQLNSPLVIILCIATLASVLLGDYLEGGLILTIVLLNAMLGFTQEFKAEKALAALKRMAVSRVRLIRDGTQQEIDSALLVPGDIIFLEEGNKVPADCNIMESMHLEVNESSLTGESMPVEKRAGGNTDENSLFLGTVIARGRATALVSVTGMQTKFGAIAGKLALIEKEETPLEKRLTGVAKQLGVLAMVSAAAILAIGIFKNNPLLEIVLTAISLAVAAVPEGLPAVITITLALGSERMAKKGAVLRKLSAIETLGSITVIATDKTGTLTKNEMRVTDVWLEGRSFSSHDAKLRRLPDFPIFLTIGSLCNNASLSGTTVVGDQTEGSLLLLARDCGINPEDYKNGGTLLEEFAFDPVTKTMSVIWKNSGGTHVYAKGAPEAILDQSKRMLTKNGEKQLTQKDRETVRAAFSIYAGKGLRVLALAYHKTPWKNGLSKAATEMDLTFVGFVGIADPHREEVPASIQMAEDAGIRTIMITGDNELTAAAIAKKVGLLSHRNEIVLTGSQLNTLTDEALLQLLPNVRVFARTTPEQKLRIVGLLQKSGQVVAVTGDGVNDALALKQANVGVAMGITGTDVAKEAAEMVITDDNYATLVDAIAEGRVIYDNMKSAIKYLIGCNLGEVIAIVGASLFGWPFILAPIHILYMNLITDGLPAIALALTPRHHAIMNRKPRTDTNLFTAFDLRWFAEVSILTATTTIFAFWLGWRLGDTALARTLAFSVIILAQQFIFWDVASADRSFFTRHTIRNIWVLLPLGIIALQFALMEIPFFSQTFALATPPLPLLIVALLVCSLMFLFAEVRKKFFRATFYG